MAIRLAINLKIREIIKLNLKTKIFLIVNNKKIYIFKSRQTFIVLKVKKLFDKAIKALWNENLPS